MKIEIYTCNPKEIVYETTISTKNNSVEVISTVLNNIQEQLNIKSFNGYIVRIDCGR